MSNESPIILPESEKLTHVSELFDVRIADKSLTPGLTKNIYYLHVDILETDPAVQKSALVRVDELVFNDVEVGERVKLRCYRHNDGTWKTEPPIPSAL